MRDKWNLRHINMCSLAIIVDGGIIALEGTLDDDNAEAQMLQSGHSTHRATCGTGLRDRAQR